MTIRFCPLFTWKRLLSGLFSVLCLCALALSQEATVEPGPDESVRIESRIAGILSAPEVNKAFWGIDVRDLVSGKVLYEHDANKLFVPASNTKLFTTATALGTIGPDFRFSTTVETSGKLDRSGHVLSDLILKGRGDPNLSGRTLPYHQKTERKLPPDQVLKDLADQLVKNGVKYIEGDLIGDDSYFAYERFGEGWAQDDLLWDYGTAVSALSINDNVIFLTILPGKRPGDAAVVAIDPEVPYYQIENKIVTGVSGVQDITVRREPGSKHVQLLGSIPLADTGFHESLAVEDPAEFAAMIFRDLLRARGVTIRGIARARHAEPFLSTSNSPRPSSSAQDSAAKNSSPTPALVLAVHESQRLIEDIEVTDKVSQNLHAELLLRLAGALKGKTADVAGGLEVVRNFASLAGISSDELALFDGSGLSRRTLVSPEAVVKLLRYVAQQPWGTLFKQALPVSGVDGSLSERLNDADTRGRVHAKTGSLSHVNGLSGYAQTASGKQVIFSILSNNHNLPGKKAIAVIDDVVRAIVDDQASSRP